MNVGNYKRKVEKARDILHKEKTVYPCFVNNNNDDDDDDDAQWVALPSLAMDQS